MAITHTIGEDDDGIRLDRWFKRHYPLLPHALLEKYLRKGLVRLDGKKGKSSGRVQAGQAISCPEMAMEKQDTPKPKRVPDAHEQADVRKWVLYKDANIIVLNKPYGLAVQGGTNINKSLDDLLGALTFESAQRPKLVHRLDRDTSGVLVLARSAKAAATLARGFAGKSIEKTYWALVNGSPLPMKGMIDLPLLKVAHGEASYEKVGVDEDEGKAARTEYRVIESLARKFAWMELKPLTGRTHQLRVHMQAIGCPIVGDGKYGGRTHDGDALGMSGALHLHARRIVIPAALLGKAVDVTAPLPQHMRKSFEALGLTVPKL